MARASASSYDPAARPRSPGGPAILRVGLTGGLGSGKSAVALVFAEGGAHVFSADEIGRALMQPGQAAFAAIVARFGPSILTPDGLLDRAALATQAFQHGRLAELNAIVHPAVLAAQQQLLDIAATRDPNGIAVIESALIFEVGNTPAAADPAPTPWRARFDRLVLVTAPDELKVARYVARLAPPGADEPTRLALARDARSRLAAQLPDAYKIPLCDYVIENTRTLVLLRRRAQAVLAALRAEAATTTPGATPAPNPGSHR